MIEQYEPCFDNGEKKALSEYMSTNPWLTEHIKTKEFEEKIKEELGFKYCSLVNNGTISLIIALKVLGIKEGDLVIVPNLTMIATINAVKFISATPIIVDIDKNTLCADPKEIIKYVNSVNIKAVIHVSLNGRWDESGELIKIREYCKKRNIAFIEDAAQAFGSNSYCSVIGHDADIASYSLSPHKIISAGQGGVLCTNNENIAKEIKKYKDFGREQGGADIHGSLGINSKFTDLQAVIGLCQISNIKYRKDRKKEIYQLYYNELKNVCEMIPLEEHTVPWFVDIYLKNETQRDLIHEKLKENKIGSRILYPPINSQKCYKEYNNLFVPISTDYSKRGLWLPSSFTLTNSQIKNICKLIKEFYV